MGTESRRDSRMKVWLKCRLRGAGLERESRVVDVSPRGIRLVADQPPERGTFVEVRLGNRAMAGRVEWTAGDRLGAVLRDPIDIDALLSERGKPIAFVRPDAGGRRKVWTNWREDLTALIRSLSFVTVMAVAIVSGFLMAYRFGERLSPLHQQPAAMVGATTPD